MRLTTERLILRDITPKDEKDLIENINNIKISRYISQIPHPYTKRDSRLFIDGCKKKSKERPRKSYNLSIELKSKKSMVGGIGLHKVDKFQGTATLGYWLGEKYWKQKIMTEAIKEILDFAFNKLRLRRIDAGVYTPNKGSNALIKKMGFKLEGTLRKAIRVKSTGKIHDENIYGLLKSEWKSARGKLK